MSIKAKICGLTTKEAIDAAIKNGADFIGFVFFPASPRNISAKKAAELSKNLPKNIKTVAVIVDMDDVELEALLKDFKPDYLQLHGHETPERVAEIKQRFAIPVIKAIAVRESDDIASASVYSKAADMLMFDARAPKGAALPGGNGLIFDWNLLKDRDFQLPWVLSGGLNTENVKDALEITGASMVDVSSAVEHAPGVKDPKLIAEFLKQVKP